MSLEKNRILLLFAREDDPELLAYRRLPRRISHLD
jgi:hypothetical protein